ncbi:MAG: desulfoferrodoxin family protein [Candidatus Falkowbacteria bacterium]
MTKMHEIYKCEVCGNITEVLHTGVGELVCCGQQMKLITEITENSQNAQKDLMDKHLPVIKELPASACRVKDGVKITIGEVEHPMSEEHHIEWIEIIVEDGKRGKRFLKHGEKPEADFYTRKDVIGARAYCNVHGLWMLKL